DEPGNLIARAVVKIVDVPTRASIHADAFRDSHAKRRPLYLVYRTESEAIEMSDDTPETTSPVLRREALLPNERSRGLGTVAVVCTMAGVASGLALATTLMAMQVADTMSARTCTYRATEVTPVAVQPDHGFLGIRYVFSDGIAQVDSVLPGT